MAKITVEIDTDHIAYLQRRSPEMRSNGESYTNPLVILSADGVQDILRQVAAKVGIDTAKESAGAIQTVVHNYQTGEDTPFLSIPELLILYSSSDGSKVNFNAGIKQYDQDSKTTAVPMVTEIELAAKLGRIRTIKEYEATLTEEPKPTSKLDPVAIKRLRVDLFQETFLELFGEYIVGEDVKGILSRRWAYLEAENRDLGDRLQAERNSIAAALI